MSYFLGQGGWACRHGHEEASWSSVPQVLCSHMGHKRPLKSPRPTVSPSLWLGLGACLLGNSWGPVAEAEALGRVWLFLSNPGKAWSRPAVSPGPRHGMGTMDGEGSHGGQTASGNLACPGGKEGAVERLSD